jgi:hypothetical protein
MSTPVDLSNSAKAKPGATYTGLGRELYVANPRFLNPFTEADYVVWSGGIDGWAIRFGNVHVLSAKFAMTENLSQAVDLNGDLFGEIEQELLTTPGYQVTIKLRAGHVNFTDYITRDAKFSIQVNNDAKTLVDYNLGQLSKLVGETVNSKITTNYWHEVTYTFTATGYDVLQLRGDPDKEHPLCSVAVTEVRAFEKAAQR